MVYVLSTYPPKACGIAVFTKNFTQSILKHKKPADSLGGSKPTHEDVGVIAMVDQGEGLEYGKEVVYKIQKQDQRQYLQAADYVNVNKPEACVIQHEFGIFGGDNGYLILSFLNRLRVRAVVVFHTILQDPDPQQKVIIKELSQYSERVVVMSEFGVKYLHDIYEVSPEKVAFIPHGVPHFKSTLTRSQLLSRKKFSGHLLVTFGLLSRNKGLESAILAMKEIVREFPEALYLIIGETHPEVVKSSGEEYRNYLTDLVEKNNLQKHVVFINSFLSEEQIIGYVSAADLYVTPYQDPNQITSGTLSYAIGSGTPFVSTPYRYAEEKAQYGCGRLFPFGDASGMAEVVKDVFSNPNKLKKMRDKCKEVRRDMSWDNVAGEYLKLFRVIGSETKVEIARDKNEIYKDSLSWMPNLNLSHVFRLSDSTGMLQHARYSTPRFKDGYCVDDNARAALLMAMAYRIKKDNAYLEKLNTYISFLDYMINEDGTVRNFMSFDRRYLDQVGSDDCYGRTLWAVGYLIVYPPSEYFQKIGEDLFQQLRINLPRFSTESSIRGMANSIMGLSYYLSVHKEDTEMRDVLSKMADRFLEAYRKNRHDDWEWFEDKMSYDNALLPLALLRAYRILGNEDYLEVGLTTSRFIEKTMTVNGYYRPVGNEYWYHKDHDAPSEYDQQPIEIMSLNWLNFHAFRITRDMSYLKKIPNVFRWFLGNNTVGAVIYDYQTNGCGDGLQQKMVNRNQGAESTLAFWTTYCLVILAMGAMELEEAVRPDSKK